MNDNENRTVTQQAIMLVDSFIMHHHAPAIPALLAACALWAVENGAPELMLQSLENTKKLTSNMAAAHKKSAQ